MGSCGVGIGILLALLCAGCSPALDTVSKDYEKSTAHYEVLLAKNPRDTALRLRLAQFYYNFNDFQKVKSLLKDSNDTTAKIMLAKTYAKEKNYNQALELFQQVGEREDSEYLYWYGKALEEQNLFPKAVAIYKKLKPPFKQLGDERLAKIGTKVEEQIPEDIKMLLRQEENFVSRVDKEEAVTLLMDEAIEVKEDNTSVATIYILQKVLKEKGKELAEVQIDYDSTDERVELEYARTITADGKMVYAGESNIRDVSKYLNFPLYSNARVFIISMPSVDVGSIIEYKAKIYSSKLIKEDKFAFVYDVRQRYPIAKARFRLTIPQKSVVRKKFFNEQYAKDISLEPTKEEQPGKTIYSWQWQEVSPIIPEPNMPELSLINPAVSISNFTSWDEIYRWWFNLYKDKIILNSELKAFVKELTKGTKNDLEKAKKIYEFCTKNIRYVAVEYGESGHEPHRADEIFVNRYGDCKDKAILLVGMLREAGLKAYPVLIPTRQIYPIEENFPTVYFNHAIAALDYNNELIFMDATASTVPLFDLPLDDQERNVLVILDDGYKIVSTPQISDNEASYEMTITIDEAEDALIERTVNTKGFFAAFQRYYLKNTHPQTIKEDIQRRMTQINPFSKLFDYRIIYEDDFDKTPVLQYRFQAKKFLNPAQNLRIVPPLNDVDVDTSYLGKEDRKYPIEFNGLFREVSRVKINLPTTLRIKYLPQNQQVITPWFTFSASYAQSGNTLDFQREFAIKKRFVEITEYKEFKKHLEEVLYLLREEAILERSMTRDAEKKKKGF